MRAPRFPVFLLCNALVVVASCALDRGGIDSPQCEALTCAELGVECGDTPDGCGGTVNCGRCPTLLCGDGAVEEPETCDDGNTSGGDGCDGRCRVQSGWVCRDAPSICSAAECGDGIIAGAEGCDDRAAVASDGCDENCTVEPGWTCSGAPSVCSAAACGDGLITAAEICDDGNTNSGDGCDARCAVQLGWVCTGSPSTCAAAQCGDAVMAGSESCDDGNAASGDGCNTICVVEAGYACTGAPSSCSPVCGDGIVAVTEACDDDNTDAGDGCSPVCNVEPGYACAGMPSTCCRAFVCEDTGANCDSLPDGCGGMITCGGPCTGTDTCGGGGEPNVCGCAPDGCDDLGVPECGVYWNPCAVALLECGGDCQSGTACVDGGCQSLTPTQVVINEFSREFDYVELLGPPGLDLQGYFLLVIEGDQEDNPGLIRWSRRLKQPGPGDPIPLDPYGYGMPTFNLPMDVRGGTVTMLLVTDYTPNTGQTDVDNNNNGQFNFEPWSEILDAVAVRDGGPGDRTYAGDAVLTRSLDSRNLPVRGASRIPNGVDTNTTSDWVRNDPMGFGITADVDPPVAPTAVNTPHGSTQSSLPGHNVAIQ